MNFPRITKWRNKYLAFPAWFRIIWVGRDQITFTANIAATVWFADDPGQMILLGKRSFNARLRV